jgi:hypothetical protein
MSAPKHKLDTETDATEATTEATTESRQVYLRDGRTLTVSEAGLDELVEIRSSSGMVELRIVLTEQGPVLQMEAVRLQLKASEAVEIESKRIDLKATETVAIAATELEVKTEADTKVDAKGEVRINGKMIYLN